jgi:beta-barrel assembly-enhancing protease
MKSAAFVLAFVLAAVPAHAQLGGLLNKAQKANDAKNKLDDLNITEQEERQLGEQVSTNLVAKYGVYQDKDVAKYVSLVGGVLAQQSSRPGLNWTFIVLDTDGVNAFAAPGGIIHVTRGLLGFARNEAELAGVLGHEITHVTTKHTVRAIQKSKGIALGSEQAGSGSVKNTIVAKMAEKAYHMVLDGEFSREDENEADRIGVQLASKLGYSPSGLVDVLKKLDARNSGREDRNGLFASHPATRDRITKLEQQISAEKLPGKATVEARYTKAIHFDAKPVTEIATDVDGAAGLAGGEKDKDKEKSKDADKSAKAEEPRKKGGLMGKFTTSSSDQKQSSQTVASAGARGGFPDRDAKGGSNRTLLNTKVTAAELEAFKNGITA